MGECFLFLWWRKPSLTYEAPSFSPPPRPHVPPSEQLYPALAVSWEERAELSVGQGQSPNTAVQGAHTEPAV